MQCVHSVVTEKCSISW